MSLDERTAIRSGQRPHASATSLSRRPIAQAVSVALCGLLLYAGQPQSVRAQAPAVAADNAVRYYRIAAGPLSPALRNLASTSQLLLTFTEDQTRGKSTTGVNGQYTPQAAMATLLAGTGLRAVALENDGGYVLRNAPVGDVDRSGTLPAVTVKASPETATGPVTGYGARRTSAATKTDTAYLEVPQAISVVTREQMEDQGIQSLSEAMRYAAGVRTDAGGAQVGANNLFVRGFNSQGKTYLDGLRLQPDGFFGFFAEEPYGLERVEIFKGPTSVLYGQSSVPGGLVSLVSKRPTEEKRGEAELSVGTNNRVQGALDVSGPATNDGRLLYRFVALARNADAEVDHLRDDRLYLAPSLTWKPNAQTSFTVLASYQKNRAMYTTNMPYAAVDGSSPYGRVPMSRLLGEPGFDYETTEVASVGYELSHALNDNWRVQQNFRHSNFDNHENYLYRNSGLIGGTNMARNFSLRHAYGTNTVVDQRLEGRFATGPLAHTMLLGLDYAQSSSKRWEMTGPASSINVFAPVYGSVIDTSAYTSLVNTEQRTKQTGIYAQDQIRLANWVATLSIRHDDVSGRTQNRLNGAVTSDRNWTANTRRAGLNYLFDNGFTPYVSYSESFNPATGTTSPARGSTSFEPERGVQYEAGIKYQPKDSSLSSTLSVFDLRRQNVSTTDPDNTLYSVQAGEVQAKGVELEVTGELTRNLKIAASYSYVDVQTTKDNTRANVGKTPARLPAKMAAAWLDYRISDGLFNGAAIGLGARYTGTSWGDAANTFRVPSYLLYDLALRYDLEKLSPSWHGWAASLNVRNLTNKYYVASCFLSSACNLGEGRSAIAKLSYKW